MSIAVVLPPEKSRLQALLDHFAIIDDPREQWRVAYPLPEVLYWWCAVPSRTATIMKGSPNGARRIWIRYYHGVPGARWLNLLMNRVDPALFSAAFRAWVRETWPDRAGSRGPSMARPRVAAMTAAPTKHRFISSLPLPPQAVSFSARRRSRPTSQRDHHHSGPDRAARQQGRPQRGAGLDRRHCDEPDHCDCDQEMQEPTICSP